MTNGKLLKEWLEVQRAQEMLDADLVLVKQRINDGAVYEHIELGLLACELMAAVLLEDLIKAHLTAVRLRTAELEK